MGKGPGIAVAVVVLVGAALGAPWVCGSIFEHRFRAALDESAAQTPYPLIVSRYERHWFGAEVETTYRIPLPDLHPAVAQPALPEFDASGDPVTPSAAPAAPARPVEFVIRHHVAHGPFATGGSLARVTSTPVWPAETQAQIAKLFKDQVPLTLVTDVGFGGALDGRVVSPAAEAAIAAPEKTADDATAATEPAAPQPPVQVKWSGIDGRYHVDGDKARHFTFAIPAPLLTVEQGPDHLTVQAIHLDGDLRRDTATGQFFVGTGGFGVDSLGFTGKGEEVQIDRFATTLAVSEHDGLLDEVIAFGADQGRGAGQTVKKPTLRIAIDNIDAAVLAEWRRQLREQMQGADGKSVTPDPVVIAASLAMMAPKLLARQPGFELQELSFDDGRGRVKLTGSARYVGKADTQLAKIAPTDFEAAADAEAPLSVVDQMLLMKAGGGDPAKAQTNAAAARDDLVRQSILVIDGDRATSVLSFKGGVLTVNGKVVPLDGLLQGAGR